MDRTTGHPETTSTGREVGGEGGPEAGVKKVLDWRIVRVAGPHRVVFPDPRVSRPLPPDCTYGDTVRRVVIGVRVRTDVDTGGRRVSDSARWQESWNRHFGLRSSGHRRLASSFRVSFFATGTGRTSGPRGPKA